MQAGTLKQQQPSEALIFTSFNMQARFENPVSAWHGPGNSKKRDGEGNRL
jgi:hypothetical protein